MSISVSQNLPEQRLLTEYDYYNDFNYPSLNHDDIIARRNLDSRDFRKRKFKQLDTKRDYSLNNYNLDIPGTIPRRASLYINKPEFNNTNLDIEKSTPTKLFKKTNKPDFIYSNRDIEFSIPRGHHVFQNDRHLNPLDPQYKLPSYEEPKYEFNQKFIRNTLDISDIEGAQPKNYYKYETHDNINIFNEKIDDDFISRRLKNRQGKNYNYLDYRDVYVKKPFSRRKISPLDPIYTLNYLNGESYTYGEIEGNKPVVFSKYNTEKDGKGNKTDDIEYAQPNTKSILNKFQLKYNRPLVYIAENIVGAQSGTRKHGIRSARMTNPLVPNYQYPGVREEKELRNRENKRYVSYNNIFDKKNNNLNHSDSKNNSFKDESDNSLNNSKVIEEVEENINNHNDINLINKNIVSRNDNLNYSKSENNINYINNNINVNDYNNFDKRNQDLYDLKNERIMTENFTQTEDDYSNIFNNIENKHSRNNYYSLSNNIIGEQPKIDNLKKYYNNLKVEQKYYPHIYKPNLTLERTSREIENNPYENQLSQFLKH
jgi:hypothetical protein